VSHVWTAGLQRFLSSLCFFEISHGLASMGVKIDMLSKTGT
jgi:hypothetical protein